MRPPGTQAIFDIWKQPADSAALVFLRVHAKEKTRSKQSRRSIRPRDPVFTMSTSHSSSQLRDDINRLYIGCYSALRYASISSSSYFRCSRFISILTHTAVTAAQIAMYENKIPSDKPNA